MIQQKTVIIENIDLSYGMTRKEISHFFNKSLQKSGERYDLQIVDIDMNPLNHQNNNCISVQVLDIKMVAQLKKLDGVQCLGQNLRIRGLNEETSQTNAQATAITMLAF